MEKKTKSKFWDLLLFVLFITCGIGASILSGIFYIVAEFLSTTGLSGLDNILYCLPGGIIAGFVGGWLEMKYAKSFWGTIGLLLGTFVLSIFLSLVSWCGFNDCLF